MQPPLPPPRIGHPATEDRKPPLPPPRGGPPSTQYGEPPLLPPRGGPPSTQYGEPPLPPPRGGPPSTQYGEPPLPPPRGGPPSTQYGEPPLLPPRGGPPSTQYGEPPLPPPRGGPPSTQYGEPPLLPPRGGPPSTQYGEPPLPLPRGGPPSTQYGEPPLPPPRGGPPATQDGEPPLPTRMMAQAPPESVCPIEDHRRPSPLPPGESLPQHSGRPPLPPRHPHGPPSQPQQYPPDRSTPSTVGYYNKRPPQPSQEYRTERPLQNPSMRAQVYPGPLNPTHPPDSPTQHVPWRPPPLPQEVSPDSSITPASPGFTSKRPSQSCREYGADRLSRSPTQTDPTTFFPDSFKPESRTGSSVSLQDYSSDSGFETLTHYTPPAPKYVPLSPSARPIHRRLVTTPPSPESAPEPDSPKAEGATAEGSERWSTGLHLVGRASQYGDVEPEEYFQTDTVLGLNKFNFDGFIKSHEKTLVMFFHSLSADSYYPSREFAHASMKSSNQNHAFAAVDCYSDVNLCCSENANQLPMIKLYSNGFTVSSLSVLKGFTADQMNMLMTMVPVFTQPRGEPSKRS